MRCGKTCFLVGKFFVTELEKSMEEYEDLITEGQGWAYVCIVSKSSVQNEKT